MSDPHRLDEWKASTLKEITQLEAKEVWDECFKSEALDIRRRKSSLVRGSFASNEHQMENSAIACLASVYVGI